MADNSSSINNDAGGAKIIYVLYLISIALGITGVIGVVMAYVNKSDAPEWLQSHYRFQIRTFWIGGLYLVIGTLLAIILIGWLVLLFWAVWLIIRSVKGMKSLDAQQPHPDPSSWWF